MSAARPRRVQSYGLVDHSERADLITTPVGDDGELIQDRHDRPMVPSVTKT
ncbi:hypothetical protein [Nocardia sp. NPDC049707]|uniref:hypothetical protein n=1 Tax=Nocardia sp. NPDC049707 TaxID=3154735 RepID=UPI003413D5CE